ncbi:MAG TPA: MBL fold metallo-hydrolase [Frankiaceae bacterium]|nr:MBL fold metallo-hydrolase [Frankiaceae bacterium]
MEVAEGVHQLGDGHVNWWAVEHHGRLTLIDSGLRGGWKNVPGALAGLGRTTADVEAVLLTHAHPDHTGGAEKLRQAGARIHAHEADEPHISGPPARPTVANVVGVLSWLHRPAFARAAAHFVRDGLLWPERVAELATFADDEVLDVPGRPRVLHLPGHTPGSCGLVFEERGLVFTGDALVTHDVYSGRSGPRLSARASNEDSQAALASLQRGDLDVDLVLPGHGPAWTGGAS